MNFGINAMVAFHLEISLGTELKTHRTMRNN
jgi:hypothetical protein